MAQYREAKTPVNPGKVLSHIALYPPNEDGDRKVEHHYQQNGMVRHDPMERYFGADEGDEMINHLRKHNVVHPVAEKADVEREKEEV